MRPEIPAESPDSKAFVDAFSRPFCRLTGIDPNATYTEDRPRTIPAACILTPGKGPSSRFHPIQGLLAWVRGIIGASLALLAVISLTSKIL